MKPMASGRTGFLLPLTTPATSGPSTALSATRSAAPSAALLAAMFAAAFAAPAAAQESSHLSDPEIAHVAVTANAIDVELAEFARSRASDPEVQGFARTMINDHTAVNERAAELAGRLGVTPLDNQLSRSLRQGAADSRGHLEAAEGPAFDLAYMEREEDYHQAVLDALDRVLIPQTSNEELKGLLEEVRPAIAAHLDHARTLLRRLKAGR